MNNRRNNAIFYSGHYWHCCFSASRIKSWLIVKECLDGFKSALEFMDSPLGWAADHVAHGQPTYISGSGREKPIQLDCH